MSSTTCDIGIGQGLVLERRVGKVPGQLRAAGDQRGGGVGVRNGDGVLVEAVEALVAPLFGGGVLQKRDCTETPTAGTAIRSWSVKSAMVLTLGLLLTR